MASTVAESERIKILIDKGNAPQYGGVGVYSAGLVDTLRRHCSKSIDIIEGEASISGTDWRAFSRLLYLRRLARLRKIGYGGAHLVHFMNYYVPRTTRDVPYVSTIYDIDPLMLPQAHSFQYRMYFKCIMNLSVNRVRLIITMSEAVRNEIVEYFKIDPKMVESIGGGLSESFRLLLDSIAPSVPEVPTLLFVGQLQRKKNIAWFVRKFSRGVRTGAIPKCKLILAGRQGYAFSEIRIALRESGSLVIWKMSPSAYDLASLYRSCTAVALPSLREGFGIPLLEAMYCNKPIVASKIPTSLEVAKDAAYFFDLENEESFFESIKRALNDVNREQREACAKKRLAHYSWESLGNQYLKAYQSALMFPKKTRS